MAQRIVARTPPGYGEFIEDLKSRIRTAQFRAALSVNRELIQLYWGIGRDIAQRQQQEGWGKAVVERLAADLHREFPHVAGFSPRNIWRMRAFFLAWTTDDALALTARDKEPSVLTQPASESAVRDLPQPSAEIPWFHNVILVQKIKDCRRRLWYAKQAVRNGWSRSMLAH